MANPIEPVPDVVDDNAPASIATPEGDNEEAPDQPLQPAATVAADGLETPRGSTPADDYKKDHD